MRWMPSNCIISLTALALCAVVPASASVKPNQPLKFSFVPPSQSTHVCITGNCSTPHVSTASGCDAAPFGGVSPELGQQLFNDDFDYRTSLTPNFNRQWHGLNLQYDAPQVSVVPSDIYSAQYTWPGETGSGTTWGAEPRIRTDLFGTDAGSNGSAFSMPAPNLDSLNFSSSAGLDLRGIPATVREVIIGEDTFYSLTFDVALVGRVTALLAPLNVFGMQTNWCRVVLAPSDPNYVRDGRHNGNSWGARLDDQWAIKRVGFTADDFSAWNKLSEDAAPVIVAVIDTGLDWHHPDIAAENVWRNEDEDPNNGIDDDNNGYIDDVVGWNFMDGSNKPWDFDGHGTIVAGIIGAAQDNNEGIAGINPNVQIMVLKAINNFGKTRASYIAEAIVYAVDNGARVINLSVGGEHNSAMEQAALAFARENGVVVVAASGNDGVELADFGPGGDDNVLTVGATHVDDRAAAFSNYGEAIDLVAPGVDVLSLRARGTDASVRPDVDDTYTFGDYFVGDDGRYYRASGTSFSTPIVAGVASLVIGQHPEYSAEDVEKILLQTAEDVELPGRDPYGGAGMVDAAAALSVTPDFYITAEISSAEIVETETGKWVHVNGTIDASEFKRAWMQIGPGENPGQWLFYGQKRKYPIENGLLGRIQLARFTGHDLWQVVINVEHENGVVRSASFPFRIQQ